MQIKEKALYMKSELILNHNEYHRLRNKPNPFLNFQAIMTGPSIKPNMKPNQAHRIMLILHQHVHSLVLLLDKQLLVKLPCKIFICLYYLYYILL